MKRFGRPEFKSRLVDLSDPTPLSLPLRFLRPIFLNKADKRQQINLKKGQSVKSILNSHLFLNNKCP